MSKQRWIVVAVGLAVVGAVLWFALGRGSGSKPAAKSQAAAPTAVTPPPTKAAADPKAPIGPPPSVIRDADPDGPLLLEGQVLDEDDQPVADALVWLSSAPPRTTRTDRDGSFTFAKLLGRDYTVGARAGDRVGGPVATKVTAQTDPVVIRLRPGAQVTVTVRDTPGDRPVAGASVVLLDGLDAPPVTTDAQGQAQFRGISDGWLAVRATAPGFAPGTATAIVSPSQRAVEIAVTLRTGAAVSGIVVDDAGAPVAGAKVWAADVAAIFDVSGNRRDPALTSAKGEFTIPALAAGSYRLAATDDLHAPAASDLITVDGERPTTGVRLVMPAGAVLAGVVVDTGGQPAPYTTVKVSGAEWANDMVNRHAVADERGQFRVGALPRRVLKVRAEAAQASSPLATVDLQAVRERTDLRLVLDQTATIAGIVVDKTGAPVAEAAVSAVPDLLAGDREVDFILASTTATTTDGGGRFVLRGLEDGGYRLVASRGGHGERTAWGGDSVAVRTGATDVRLVLPTPGGIRGKIVLAGGDPPGLAMVSAGSTHRVTTRDGKFELTGLTPGNFDLRMAGPDFAERVQADVAVADGVVTDLGTIEVVKGRSASGRVVDGKGAPVAGANVMMDKMIFGDGQRTSADGIDDSAQLGMRTATTGADGSFTLRGIARDGGIIIAEHPTQGRSIALTVAAGADDVRGLTVTLRGYGSLTGTVTRKGAPVSGAAISAAPLGASGQAVFVTTGADGKFILDKVPAGPTAVTAMKQSGMASISASKEVTVIVGQPTEASIDIPAGELALTVTITAKPGDKVDAAWILLVRGTFAAGNGKALLDAMLSAQGGSGGGAAGTDIWLGTPTFPTFRELVAGSYTVCAMPITGNILDPQLSERINANLEQLEVVCKAVTVTPTPAAQGFTLVAPAMKPLTAGAGTGSGT